MPHTVFPPDAIKHDRRKEKMPAYQQRKKCLGYKETKMQNEMNFLHRIPKILDKFRLSAVIISLSRQIVFYT